MFFRVVRALLGTGLRNADETVFHLLAYKHMREHYFRIAAICDSRS
jgi:hypothetical protein